MVKPGPVVEKDEPGHGDTSGCVGVEDIRPEVYIGPL